MSEDLVAILHIATLEHVEGVQERVLAVRVSEVEIILHRIEDESVVLLYVTKRVADIHALSNRDYKLGCMGHHSRAVLAASKVIALGLEFNVSSAHLQLLELALHLVIRLHVAEERSEGVIAVTKGKIKDGAKSNQLPKEQAGKRCTCYHIEPDDHRQVKDNVKDKEQAVLLTRPFYKGADVRAGLCLQVSIVKCLLSSMQGRGSRHAAEACMMQWLRDWKVVETIIHYPTGVICGVGGISDWIGLKVASGIVGVVWAGEVHSVSQRDFAELIRVVHHSVLTIYNNYIFNKLSLHLKKANPDEYFRTCVQSLTKKQIFTVKCISLNYRLLNSALFSEFIQQIQKKFREIKDDYQIQSG